MKRDIMKLLFKLLVLVLVIGAIAFFVKNYIVAQPIHTTIPWNNLY